MSRLLVLPEHKVTKSGKYLGRPHKITQSVVRKLEDAFSRGCTDREACLRAGILPSTLYQYCKTYPQFAEHKEALKSNPIVKARYVVSDALDAGDIITAHKVLDRHEGTKVKIAGVIGTTDLSNMTDDQLRALLES